MATDIKNDGSLGASLSAHYEMDNVNDSTVNAYHGTNVGVAFETGGARGNKGTFVIAESDRISLPTGVGKTANWSISAWIKATSWPACGIVFHGTVADRYWGIFAQAGAAMQLYQSTGGDTFCSGDFTGGNFTWNSTNYPNSAWVHIVGTGDGSNFNFYRNGTAHGTPVAITKANSGTAYSFSLGDFGGAASNFFGGGMDEVTIWSKALTGSDVTALYNSGTPLPFDAGGASGPANLKSYNTNLKANIKSINTNLIANIKSINTNV